MYWVPKIIQAAIVAIALYFMLAWGSEAVRTFISESYGIDDLARAQALHALGRMLDLGRNDLIRLAVFIAAFKLTAVGVFAIHLIGRARAAPGAVTNHDILEAALLLVVFLTAALAVPAIMEKNGVLIRHCAIDLLVAGVAAILSVIDRIAVAVPEPARRGASRRSSSWLGR